LAVVIFTGNIDLSVGSVASLASVVLAALWQGGLNIWLAAAAALVVCAIVGLVNRALVVGFGIDSLLVTLATSFILASLSTARAAEQPAYGFPDPFTQLGLGQVGAVPVQLIAFAALAVAMLLLVHRTGFGRAVVLIGHNPSAARYSGIRTGRILVGS